MHVARLTIFSNKQNFSAVLKINRCTDNKCTMYSCKILNRMLVRLKSMTDGGGFQLKQLCRDIEQRSLPPNRFSSLRALSSCNKKMSKYTIVMVRHGESEWNQLNLFCGWYDANLSDKGKSF